MHADALAACRATAQEIAALLRAACERRGVGNVAFSGGRHVARMLRALRDEDVPWSRVHVFQVDERVAPDGDPDRNATVLQAELLDKVSVPPVNVHLLPVTEPDLETAAARFGAALPRFDVMHLGLGEDGHTASWPPGDPVVALRHRPLAVVGPFNGRVRMTVTPGVVAKAHDIVFLVTGTSKREALDRLRAGDATLPASHVPLDRTVVHCDREAYGD